MKVEIDTFSGARVYPGRGKLFIRGDSKIFRFFSSKSASLFSQRKNPRQIAWTTLYRRHHRKGQVEEASKRRSRKVLKTRRAVVGASLEDIKERQAKKPETRKAERDAAIAKAKEQKKAQAEKRKQAKVSN